MARVLVRPFGKRGFSIIMARTRMKALKVATVQQKSAENP